MKFPDFRVCTRKYVVEQNPKWRLGDTDTVMYEKTVEPDNNDESYGKEKTFK